MITISLCMIVKNEEQVLERCLSSVKDIADEIIIVDTGSTDATKNVASKFTNNIYHFDWINDFSAARNYSFSKATKDYQMWLDADDIITGENREKILKLKSTLEKTIDIVTMKYHTHFDENNIPIHSSTRGRLFKREKNYFWNDPVHEYIEFCGSIFYADDIYITHKKEVFYTDRNLKIYENLIKEGKSLSPRNVYYFARELKDNYRYGEAVEFFSKFLNDGLGWVEDNIASCLNLGICYKTLGEKEKSLEAFLRSFKYDLPRAEICCQIGYYYKDLTDYAKAAFWFDLAARLEKPNTIGFFLEDCWGYIPNIELCVCYYNLGKLEKAIFHNNMAGKFKPDSKKVKYNEDFFKTHHHEIITV